MINRPKENDMNDLDQSDVNRDAMNRYQEEFDELGEHLDGADLYTVIQTLITNDLLSKDDAMDSRVVQELILHTQSNPAKSEQVLSRMIELDNAIANL